MGRTLDHSCPHEKLVTQIFPMGAGKGKVVGMVTHVMTTDERRLLARYIRPLREVHDLTQGELAQSANVSRRQLGSIERGDAVPHEDVLRRVLKALRIDVDDVTDGEIERFTLRVRALLRLVPRAQRGDAFESITGSLTNAALSSTGVGISMTLHDGDLVDFRVLERPDRSKDVARYDRTAAAVEAELADYGDDIANLDPDVGEDKGRSEAK